MAKAEQAGKALEVKATAERLHAALLRVHRLLGRLLAGGPKDRRGGSMPEEVRENSLRQKCRLENYRDATVLGFWYRGLNSPKYVASSPAMDLIWVVRQAAVHLSATANAWHARERTAAYHEFLQEAQQLEADVLELEPSSRKMVERHRLDMLRLQRTIGMTFPDSAAEARMISYLMRRDVTETVHVYATDSPTGQVCRAYAALGPQREATMKRRQMTAAGARLPGVGWQIGWVFYGRRYQTASAELMTDLRALETAVKNGSIAGHEQV